MNLNKQTQTDAVEQFSEMGQINRVELLPAKSNHDHTQQRFISAVLLDGAELVNNMELDLDKFFLHLGVAACSEQ